MNVCGSSGFVYYIPYEFEHCGEKIRVGARNEGDRRRLRGSSHVLRTIEDSF